MGVSTADLGTRTSWWLTPLRVLAAVLGTNVVLIALLGLTYAIPNGPIIQNVNADFKAGRLAKNYPASPLGGTLDGYTQCLGTTSGVLPVDSSLDLPLRVAMVPRGAGGCKPAAEFFAQLRAGGPFADDETGPAFSYIRYWSGYSVISRPALALGGIRATQAATAILLVAASAFLGWAVYRRVGGLPAATLVGTYLLTTNTLATPLAFTQGIAEAVLLAGAAAVLLVPRRWILPAAAGAAATFVFVDLLTVPATAWALTAFSAAVRAWAEWAESSLDHRRSGGRPWAKVLRSAAYGAIAWAFGYGVTWVGRWLFAMIYSGPQAVFDNVISTAKFRIDGDVSPSGVVVDVDSRPLVSIYRNLSYWAHTPGAWYAVVILAIAAVTFWQLRASVAPRGGLLIMIALMVPALLVPCWYEFLKNHSQVHSFFTHRSLGMALAIVVTAAAIASAGRLGDEDTRVKY